MNPVNPQQIEAVKTILAGMISPDATARQTALRLLLQQPPSSLPIFANAMSAPDGATAKAARAAMERLLHHLLTPAPGKDKPNPKTQTQVADELGKIAESSEPRAIRACALSLLGFAGTKRQEKLLERLEMDREIGEDARMARTRIKSVGY